MTSTQTRSATTTIAGGDVRKVINLASQEIRAICSATAQVTRDFDTDQAEIDLALLCLNDVISAMALEVYLGDEIVRQYTFVIAAQLLPSWGPPPDQPPLGPVPPSARVRLTVTPNPAVAKELRDDWFRKLGWRDAEPLRLPEGATLQVYGTYVSGGYGVERQLLVNPKFDRPVALAPGSTMRKE
jgi:hypothetical protein